VLQAMRVLGTGRSSGALGRNVRKRYDKPGEASKENHSKENNIVNLCALESLWQKAKERIATKTPGHKAAQRKI
jgi:hypothetical protein